MPNGAPLDQQLILAPWFAYKLGYSSIPQMLSMLSGVAEGGNEKPNKVLTRIMESKQADDIQIPLNLLNEMDNSIADDLAHINRGRTLQPISLKYFQYLAALATEYFLHCLKESPHDLAKDLNNYRSIAIGNHQLARNLPEYDADNPEHFAKLALWMATGSGKTLLMHLNIRQFIRHKIFTPDNILLITPNTELTAQHITELRASGISCHRHGETPDIFTQQNSVCVIEIHKLRPSDNKPTKKGVSVPTDRFTGHNLILVDEGHKGTAGKRYFEIRDQLVENGGFAFEYSATFGQAIATASAANRPARTKEYGRAIVFDYSYRHFYADGYGKDYFVLNMSREADDKPDILMLGNLLAFFQQQFAYKEYGDEFEIFQIAKPLLLMLGATVTGGNSTDEETTTDIIKIIGFLQRVAADKNQKKQPWLEKLIEKIINGKSGIADNNGDDIFADKFKFLREYFSSHNKLNTAKLCGELRQTIFHTDTAADVQFRPLKKTMQSGDGNEIALRAGDGAPPFALVYVGNAAKLRALAEKHGIRVEEDSLQSPLFPHVNDYDSPVNILIGAKKFMEGWNSWRVSSIGLLNVGRGEGPLIVQLFGRGIRLKGRDWSLKRSAALPEALQPSSQIRPILELLETLNIFGIRAEFMAQFREYLADAGQVEELIQIPVRVMPTNNGKRDAPEINADDFRRKNLLMPQNPPDESPEMFELQKEKGISVTVDLSSSVTLTTSRRDAPTIAHQTREHNFNAKYIDLDDLYLYMLDRKNTDNESNIFVCFENLKDIVESCNYLLDRGAPQLRGMRLQEAAKKAVRQYADKLNARHRRRWQRDNMQFAPLESGGENRHANFADYVLRLPSKLVDGVRQIKQSPVLLYTEDSPNDRCLPRLYFDRHLYQPLLLDNKNMRISPPPLNRGETRLIEALSEYAAERNSARDGELFLLRNHSKSGVAFYLENGGAFYPDFMLWIVGKNRQRLVFLEPHGMRMANGYDVDGKAQFWEYLLNEFDEDKLPKNPQLKMDSFILSVTPYEELKDNYVGKGGKKWNNKKEFAEHNILFMEDLDSADTRSEFFARIVTPPQKKKKPALLE